MSDEAEIASRNGLPEVIALGVPIECALDGRIGSMAVTCSVRRLDRPSIERPVRTIKALREGGRIPRAGG